MRKLLIACFLLLLPACGGKGDANPEPTPTEDIFKHRGTITPLHEAIAGVAFRPFIPSRVITETALLPPYNGGDDVRKNRGIGFEYESKHVAYMLSEWPGAGKPGPRSLGTVNGCELTAYDINGGADGKQGALWSSGRVVYNLIPVGDATNKQVFAEARRLVTIGACR